MADRWFDRILFLQSFGYAADGFRALLTAREMLTEDGYVLLTRTQPIRYALERAEQNGTTLGEEYFATEPFAYRHRGWCSGCGPCPGSGRGCPVSSNLTHDGRAGQQCVEND